MGAFINLDDSPMFQKQISGIEQQTDELKDRCQRLYKGCKKYMETLGEACNGDTNFADSLEAFGGGQDDPVSVSIGGPVMSKFIAAFRELASYKELLRSQVEHVLIDRLSQFLSVDVQDAKVSRQRFDKAIHAYDQARDKCSSLKKSTRDDVVADLEEDLHNSKSAFERSRFNLVSSLMNIEAKKKYEFLESFSAIMDAHLRFFKLGYELLSQLEPFIHQVLTYAQQSKELANIEQDNLAKRIQEFRTQTELDQLRASSNVEVSTSAVHINGVGMSSYKNIEAIMQSTAKGEIQTIKQGYLLKRSSSLRVDWKRRFFVLDGHGKRSSRKVVIRNINYITSKGDGEKGSASEDSSDEHESINAESLKQQVEEAVGSLERHHKSTSRNNKKRDESKRHSIVNGSNTATEQENENVVANNSGGGKTNETWDIFQNLLMRETDSISNGIDAHAFKIQEEHVTNKNSKEGIPFALGTDSEVVTKHLASTDSFIVTDRDTSNEAKIHVENFEARDNPQPIIKKRDSAYEELLFSQRTEATEKHSSVALSDYATQSSAMKNQKGGDWFPGNQPDKSQDASTRHNIFDGDFTSSSMGDHSQLEKNKKDVLIDDSFMVHAHSMDNDPSDSQLKRDIYMVSEIVGDTQPKISLQDNSQEKVEANGIFEPDDLFMVLGRNSDEGQVVASWNPEMDYEKNNSLTKSVQSLPKVELTDGVDPKPSSGNKRTNSKASGAPGGKASSKEARSKTSVGSLGRSKPEIVSRSKKPVSGSRIGMQKSKSEKDEESKKKMEELLIQRQKRIAERSAARGSATSKRTSEENKTSLVSMKNEKPKLQSPKETEKLQKPILRNSTIDRLAAARVTPKLSSTEAKSSQPRKAISKTSETENKKPGTNRVNSSDKTNGPKNSNGLLSSDSGTQRKKDSADSTIAFPAESSTGRATKPSDAIDDSENIKELHSISSIEKDEVNRVLERDTSDDTSSSRNSPNGDFSIPIQHHSAQLVYLKGDSEVTSKASPVLEDVTVSNGHVQFVPEVTIHPLPPSPKKALNSTALRIDEDGEANEKFSVSPEISVVEMSTPPPNDKMAPEPIHSRKKWNSDENSPKATKGFRKLLLFGRKTRNTPTN